MRRGQLIGMVAGMKVVQVAYAAGQGEKVGRVIGQLMLENSIAPEDVSAFSDELKALILVSVDEIQKRRAGRADEKLPPKP